MVDIILRLEMSDEGDVIRAWDEMGNEIDLSSQSYDHNSAFDYAIARGTVAQVGKWELQAHNPAIDYAVDMGIAQSSLAQAHSPAPAYAHNPLFDRNPLLDFERQVELGRLIYPHLEEASLLLT